ncbi:single-stranded-DNA-specific exonuclease RecJ [Candidatus Pelagibacter bacterium nBUS_30]|uniref:single-stranded-DNA-specific exonuclease RecJ n=1 Tax=Candidatus Pelagibacter bacterium nBUS_30 TaxID=3374191 RepID=UPI003EC150B9
MISVSGKNWIERKVNKNSVEKIKQDYMFNEILSKLIVSRNFDEDEISNINNNLKIINIFKNDSDFKGASEILNISIRNNEKICILGDYDADGTVATSLLVRYFNYIKQPHFYYIPDRVKDGYGATKKLFQKLILNQPKLVIMVDCGSTSNEAIDFLNENKIKSIILDHHEINKPYPKSNIIINPKKKNTYDEDIYLCATSLTYFFLDYFIKKNNSNFRIDKYLIYVLLATVCDVMPLRKINKIIASNVIKNFRINDNAVFKFIFDQLGLSKQFSIEDLGFLIGPIINSGGRLGFSNYGTELLTTDDPKLIQKRSIELIKLNEKRKILEQNILDEIDYEKINKQNQKVIIYYNANINEGLIGIIAARLKDYFNKPSIVITKSNKILKASARSTKDYNIGKLIKLLIEKKIIQNGGGHNMAAGFSLKKENVLLLDNFIQKDYKKNIKDLETVFRYDAEISATSINTNLFNEINKLGPFGNGNILPIFLIKNVKILKSNIVSESHVNVIIKPHIGTSIKAICFNCANTKVGQYLLSYKKQINIIAQITENSWNNKKSLQLNIKDLILSVN